MKVLALMYHDIVPAGGEGGSGFSGNAADRYKVTPDAFRDHLRAIARAAPAGPSLVTDAGWNAGPTLLLTFDDGGAGALRHAAGILEEFGWRGHFLVTAALIGSTGFVDAAGVRELARRGHAVGSHSLSHPPRISHLPFEAIVREWAESAGILSDITGEPVRIASVPSGYYSEKVALAAAEAGMEVLFTSQPTRRVRTAGGCAVMGRYAVLRRMRARTVAAIAAGDLAPRTRQFLAWEMKKVAKAIGGERYLALRERLLGVPGKGGR